MVRIVEKPGEPDVCQVGRIGRVLVVGFGDALSRPGGDPAVERRPARRGGEYQGDQVAPRGVDDACAMASVAADHLAVAGRALGAGVGDVGAAQVGPLKARTRRRWRHGRDEPLRPGSSRCRPSGPGPGRRAWCRWRWPARSMPPNTGADVRVESFPTTVGASWVTDIYVGATQPGAG
jgi:hypothetical protein